MSWSIEEHIGECRPFPAQVVVYRGETGECLAYVSGEAADRLKAENKQLRELVTRALAQHLSARYEFESTEEYEKRLSALLKKMKELGVEVDK